MLIRYFYMSLRLININSEAEIRFLSSVTDGILDIGGSRVRLRMLPLAVSYAKYEFSFRHARKKVSIHFSTDASFIFLFIDGVPSGDIPDIDSLKKRLSVSPVSVGNNRLSLP